MFSAALSNLKKVSLELGGKSPLIIFSDCDMDKAVRFVSKFRNTISMFNFDIMNALYLMLLYKEAHFFGRCFFPKTVTVREIPNFYETGCLSLLSRTGCRHNSQNG